MTPRLLLLSALETCALILCAINCPGYTLAAILAVGSACALVGGMWLENAAWDSRAYADEHDLAPSTVKHPSE